MRSTTSDPLAVELLGLARRMLGSGPAAREAVLSVLGQEPADRLEAIGLAAAACRRHEGEVSVPAQPGAASLAQATAAELARANAILPVRLREILALRELLRLSYAQIGQVMGLEVQAVASLLGRSRLRLRDELRGVHPGPPPCPDQEHALRILARRQDSEPLVEADDDWIFDHLAGCPGCERSHATMLETSVRYRAWTEPAPE